MEIIFSIFFLVVGFLSGKAKRKYQENIGEHYINAILSKHFASEEYHLLKNVTLPIVGGTTQIDHVLVSTKGIFVIETKNHSHWIFGTANQPRWTQRTLWGKYQFQNPIHQNYKHIKELGNYFDFLPENVFKSIVVFSGDPEFKTKMPANVLYSTDLVNYINTFNEEIISLNRLFFVVGKLEFFRKEVSLATDEEHIKYLRKKFGKTAI